jgi:hypothetical protein
MNRELLVTLIRKNIDELIMLTEGFMEMDSYPAAIINLAKNKTDDIWSYINQLERVKITPQSDISTGGKSEMLEEDALTSVLVDHENAVEDQIEVEQEPDEESVVTETVEESVLGGSVVEESVMEDSVVEETVFAKENLEESTDEEEVLVEEIQEEVDQGGDDVEFEPITAQETDEEISEKEDEIDMHEDEYDKTIEDELEITTTINIRQSETETETIEEKKITLAERISASSASSRNDSLGNGDNGGLNTVLRNQKVDDIRQAISLGDRFRFQRELFKNNGEEMNKTLSYINMLATYEEVISFLQSKYGWKDDNPTAEDFYQLVKRKF